MAHRNPSRMSPAILVPDAHARALIAAIRSLGRAGYRVHATSYQAGALGLKSNYARHSVIHPDYHSPQFIPWLRQYVADHDIRMIVPSAGLLFAVQSVFDEFSPLLPVTDNSNCLYRCFDKTEVVSSFQAASKEEGLLRHHPRSAIIDLSAPVDHTLLPDSTTGFFIKAEANRDQTGIPEDRRHNGFAFAQTPEETISILRQMGRDWHRALVQQACTGRQVCVSVLMDGGRALAVSSVQDCHPRPHSRGTMSLRKSARFPDIEADAVRRLAHLKWQGCAMGEYRLDESTGHFNLIEINFRFWQYLHLDLWANMDYPRMQAEWFLEGKTDFTCATQTGVVCRDTWPGEVAQLLSELRRTDLGAVKKLQAIAMFVTRCLDPRIHTDMSFPRDRKLYWRNLLDYLRLETTAIRNKLNKARP